MKEYKLFPHQKKLLEMLESGKRPIFMIARKAGLSYINKMLEQIRKETK